jgi:hypothetical protein
MKIMEELKKKFIVEEKLEEKKISEYVERVLPFCKISQTGEVIVERKDISSKEKVALALVARFLGNYLQKEVLAEVSVKDLSSFLDIPENQVVARLKELKDKDKIAILVKKGVYKANPLQIGRFLEDLENKYGAK